MAVLVVLLAAGVWLRGGGADPIPQPVPAGTVTLADIPAPSGTCPNLEDQLAVSDAPGPRTEPTDVPVALLVEDADLPVAVTGEDRTFTSGIEWFDTDRSDAALRMALLEEWGLREVALREIETAERFDLLVVEVQAFEDHRGATAWNAWALRQVCDGLSSRTFPQLPDGFGLKWRSDRGWTEQLAFVHGPYRFLVRADIEADRRPRDWFLVEVAEALARDVAVRLGDGEAAP